MIWFRFFQAENSRNHSGSSRSIPFHSAADDNHSDQSYQPNIVMPAHRKQTKKRRKKGRNRKRKQRKHRKTTYSSLEDYLNLTVEHRKNRNAKVTCSDCKIRKRKGRREKLYAGKISPSVLRKVLEKVADDTLSGARTGTGTIQSLFEDELVRKNYGRDEEETGWSYDQHWVSIASGDTINSDETIYRTGQFQEIPLSTMKPHYASMQIEYDQWEIKANQLKTLLTPTGPYYPADFHKNWSKRIF